MSEHLGELLSAHLDGELTADEIVSVQEHLAECDACRTELEATRAIRATLRAAPEIDPPFGFYERLLGRRRRPRWIAAASVGTVAAAWLVVVGFAVSPPAARVVPPVDQARATLANTHGIQVTVMRGDVDWPKLQGGLRKAVDRLPGTPWESTNTAGPKAIVFEDDSSVVLVVGDVPTGELEQAARQASTSRSIVDRLRDAAGSVMDGFSLR
jgi:hypothetical protein